MAFQQQVKSHIPANEGRDSVDGERISGNSERPCAYFAQLQVLLCHGQKHIPVHSQMQAHQHKAPKGAENMQLSGQFIATVLGEKRKHMAGQHNAADHGADHAQENQPCQCRLHDAAGACSAPAAQLESIGGSKHGAPRTRRTFPYRSTRGLPRPQGHRPSEAAWTPT